MPGMHRSIAVCLRFRCPDCWSHCSGHIANAVIQISGGEVRRQVTAQRRRTGTGSDKTVKSIPCQIRRCNDIACIACVTRICEPLLSTEPAYYQRGVPRGTWTDAGTWTGINRKNGKRRESKRGRIVHGERGNQSELYALIMLSSLSYSH